MVLPMRRERAICCAYYNYLGSRDVYLYNSHTRILPGQAFAPVRFTLPIDKVAQEENETFSLSISGFDYSKLGENYTIIQTLNVTIIDGDGKLSLSSTFTAYISISDSWTLCMYVIFAYVVVAFEFSEEDFSGREGENSTISVKIRKQHKLSLANEVTLRVTPLTVEMALQNRIISAFRDEALLSPNRAGKVFTGSYWRHTYPRSQWIEATSY